jgi:hypothetical protein
MELYPRTQSSSDFKVDIKETGCDYMEWIHFALVGYWQHGNER